MFINLSFVGSLFSNTLHPKYSALGKTFTLQKYLNIVLFSPVTLCCKALYAELIENNIV